MNDKIVYDIPDDINIIYLEKSVREENSILKILKIPLLAHKYKTICKNYSVDISLSFMYRPNFINTFSKYFGNKSKIVISERNTASMTYEGNKVSSFIGRFLVKSLYKKADLIIPNSNGNSDDLINNFGIEGDKVKVVPNPVNIDLIQEMAREKIEDITFDKFTFISVARLEKHKRHDITIKAYSRIANDKNQLLILGVGDQYDYLQKLIVDLGLDNNIKLIGFKKNPYKYIYNSNCFILSSSREGFPNVLLEALACGVAILSSDCKSGPSEILDNEKHGLLYPVGDLDSLVSKMKYCLYDNKNFENIKEKNIERVKMFSIDKIVKKLTKVLDSE